MSDTSPTPLVNQRILVVDDNPAIHEDIRKILGSTSGEKAALKAAEMDLFGTGAPAGGAVEFQIDSAYRGETALEMVKQSLENDEPYAMAFVDMRMPPGWDGLETITRLWEVNPELQIVICTAYSDHSWTDIVQRLRPQDDLMVLRKPFDVIEIRQFAHTLCAKWVNRRKVLKKIHQTEVELLDAQQHELMRELATEMATERAALPMETTREDLQVIRARVDRLWSLIEQQHRALQDSSAQAGVEMPMHLVQQFSALNGTRVELHTALARIFRNTLAVKAVVRSVRSIAHHRPETSPASVDQERDL